MKTTKYLLGTALGLLATASFNQSVLAQDTVRSLDELIIHDTRVSNKSPLATSIMSKEQISDNRMETTIPYIIELQPSVVTYTENCQAGNTYMRIRGVDASRINVNINGITLNDAESQSVFWVNIPNLGGMAQSLQVQRGIGASTGGSAAFGASLNLQTLNAPSTPYANADLSVGSWNTRQYSISAGTGITKHGFAFDIGYNGLTTDGYIRNGYSDQQSLFLCGSHYGDRSLLKALVIIGKQHTGITWNGAYGYELDDDPRHNGAGAFLDSLGNTLYYGNESDNYNQQRFQIYYNYMFSDAWNISAAFDLTHGYGFYENYLDDQMYLSWYGYTLGSYGLSLNGDPNALSDLITRMEMNNNAYTANVAARYSRGKLALSFGENFLFYDGNQYGNVIWADQPALGLNNGDSFRWYDNDSKKADATTFVKLNYDFSDNFNLYGDFQLRFINYSIEGIHDDLSFLGFKENYLFFNPKLGLNYRISDSQRTYIVAGISQREPTRSDIVKNVTCGDTIKAETMLDIELGYQLAKEKFAFSANLYAMLYKDQLTASGEPDNVGYALMENVDKSYRLGIEVEGGYRFTKWFKLDANLTLSSNKIIDYKYADFNDGDAVKTSYVKNTDLSFSPSAVGAVIATFEPVKDLKFQLTGKYVGEMYGDNTSREAYKQDAYFLVNFKTSYVWRLKGNNEIEAQFMIHNLFNRKYRVIAWISDSQYDGGYHKDCAYFQQPGINFAGRLAFKF